MATAVLAWSSLIITLTGWPLIPPWAFVQASQAWSTFPPPARDDAKGPVADARLPMVQVDLVAGADADPVGDPALVEPAGAVVTEGAEDLELLPHAATISPTPANRAMPR